MAFNQSVITGLFTLGGAFLGAFLSHIPWYIDRKKEKEKLRLILEAIYMETSELLEITSDIFGMIKKVKEDEPVTYFLKNTQNYFSTYENNVHIIENICDGEYKKNIIKHYLLSKRFLDALLSNSLYFEKSLENTKNYAFTGNNYFKDLIPIFDQAMSAQTKNLKKLVTRIEINIDLYKQNHEKFMRNFF